ncbi:DUF257 family protein [Thermococcus sp.]
MPMKKSAAEAFESIGRLQPGEIVVVEHTSLDPFHLAVLLVMASRGKDMHIAVADVFDQLHVVRSHLAIMGIDTGLIDDVPVVKFGGMLTTGNVIRRISILDTPTMWQMEYRDALEGIPEPRLVLTLGFEKLITIKPEVPPSTMCRLFMMPSMGMGGEVNVIFVNSDMLTENALEDIRELASRVFRLGLIKNMLTLTVVKSLSLKHYGRVLAVDAVELTDYLGQAKG